MELSTSYFATCTKAELILLEDLAREHRQRLRVKHIETPHATQIVIESDSEQLRDFIYFMLQRLRSQQRALERHWIRACMALHPDNAVPPGGAST
ncbi:MAG: hypothetical protein VKP62_16490 [Candidatus Sericytochromatia bacterium]|nr:hypothetical protein [Candidatus Sericytochromatia bacterium]